MIIKPLTEFSPWRDEPKGENIRYVYRVSDANFNSCFVKTEFKYPKFGYVQALSAYGLHGVIDGFLKHDADNIIHKIGESIELEPVNGIFLSYQILAVSYEECVHDPAYGDDLNVVRFPRGWVCYCGHSDGTAFSVLGVKNGTIKSRHVQSLVSNLGIGESFSALQLAEIIGALFESNYARP